MRKNRILVLGATGMLGSMVSKYLRTISNFDVTATDRKKFDAELFLQDPVEFEWIKKFDYVVNCIGIIKPYCADNDPAGVRSAIAVNALFPYRFISFVEGVDVKIIQIATDCVYSGKVG